jgi:hypothetical protein
MMVSFICVPPNGSGYEQFICRRKACPPKAAYSLPKFAKALLLTKTERTKEWRKIIYSLEPFEFDNNANPHSFTTKI